MLTKSTYPDFVKFQKAAPDFIFVKHDSHSESTTDYSHMYKLIESGDLDNEVFLMHLTNPAYKHERMFSCYCLFAAFLAFKRGSDKEILNNLLDFQGKTISIENDTSAEIKTAIIPMIPKYKLDLITKVADQEKKIYVRNEMFQGLYGTEYINFAKKMEYDLNENESLFLAIESGSIKNFVEEVKTLDSLNNTTFERLCLFSAFFTSKIEDSRPFKNLLKLQENEIVKHSNSCEQQKTIIIPKIPMNKIIFLNELVDGKRPLTKDFFNPKNKSFHKPGLLNDF